MLLLIYGSIWVLFLLLKLTDKSLYNMYKIYYKIKL